MQGKTKHPTRLFALLAILTILLAACRAPAESESHAATPDINQLYTQVAGTLIAQGQQEQPDTATIAPTQTPFVVTATPSATSQQPSNTPTNTPAPPTNTSAPPAPVCNQAAFITDVTVKDGTQMSKDESFTKTWRIKNTGTCTWTNSYTVVFSSGTNLANKSSYDLPEDVSPGETVDISILMKAPTSNGTYTSNWVLRPGSSATFGVGGSGGSAGVPVFAVIKVGTGGGSGSGLKYDFAAHYCNAHWSSGTKNNLPCPGANQGTNGFVIVLQNPDLESNQENDPAIWMRPDHNNHGFIRGVFPDYTVKNGDHFVATIGCLDNNTGCRVQFTLSYIRPNGNEVQLGTWDEKFDGLVRHLDIDLSSLAGKDLKFVLMVEPSNTNYNKANAFWFLPQITNP